MLLILKPEVQIDNLLIQMNTPKCTSYAQKLLQLKTGPQYDAGTASIMSECFKRRWREYYSYSFTSQIYS